MRRLLIALVALAGCHTDVCKGVSTCIAVHVVGSGNVTSVDQLRISATLNGMSIGAPHTTPAAPSQMSLPLDVGVVFGAGESGAGTVSMAALAHGSVEANGSVPITVVTGQHGAVTLTLSPGAPTQPHDMSVPLDAGVADASTIDLAHSPDLGHPATLTSSLLVAGELQSLVMDTDGTLALALSSTLDLQIYDGMGGAHLGTNLMNSPTLVTGLKNRRATYCWNSVRDMTLSTTLSSCYAFDGMGSTQTSGTVVSKMFISPDGTRIAYGGETGTLTTNSTGVFVGLPNSQSPVAGLQIGFVNFAFNPQSGVFYAAMINNGTMGGLYALASGAAPNTATSVCANCGSFAVSNDGSCIVAALTSGGDAGSIGPVGSASTTNLTKITKAVSSSNDATPSTLFTFATDKNVADYVGNMGSIDEINCDTNSATTRIATGALVLLGAGKGWRAFATTLSGNKYTDVKLLVDGSDTPVAIVSNDGFLSSVSPAGNLAIEISNNPGSPTAQLTILVTSPTGTHLASMSGGQPQFVDDNHFAFRTSTGDLMLYDLTYSVATKVASNVDSFTVLASIGRVYWIENTPGGLASDGIHWGALM
jgi:hypothetical protein